MLLKHSELSVVFVKPLFQISPHSSIDEVSRYCLITVATFIFFTILITIITIIIVIIIITIIIITIIIIILQMSRHLFLSSPHSSSPQVDRRNIMSKVFIRYHPLRLKDTQINSYNNTPHFNRPTGRPLHHPREGTKHVF